MQQTEWLQVLATMPLCQDLTAQELELLIAHSKIISFSTGDIIIQQGKKSPGMFIILNGIAITKAKVLGEAFTNIATLKTGELLGETRLILGGPSTTSVIASSPIQCLLISEELFEFIADFFPTIKQKMIKNISQQVSNDIERLQAKIIEYIDKSSMATRSFIGEVLQSFTKSTVVKFENVLINPQELVHEELFQIFTEDELQNILNQAVLIEAPKHCPLIKEGDKNNSCYIMLRGAVQSSVVHKNKLGKLSVVGPMLLFCSNTNFTDHPIACINYTTCEHSILLKISFSLLKEMKESQLQMWSKISYLMCKSLISLKNSLEKFDIRLKIESYNR